MAGTQTTRYLVVVCDAKGFTEIAILQIVHWIKCVCNILELFHNNQSLIFSRPGGRWNSLSSVPKFTVHFPFAYHWLMSTVTESWLNCSCFNDRFSEFILLLPCFISVVVGGLECVIYIYFVNTVNACKYTVHITHYGEKWMTMHITVRNRPPNYENTYEKIRLVVPSFRFENMHLLWAYLPYTRFTNWNFMVELTIFMDRMMSYFRDFLRRTYQK